ncbi:PucR family transcriptional regulator [Paenibacillus cremeus]|uniref:PucR family transcriptional regulator n=1 Tax=Paenibacillus cremeus TaxID=2163881 RepID=A0A559KDW2_9BACL|nr:helix-turn-helix domain-containing protein [Paenibacillus cremeus]TVY10322.1 PucR family transcriptional regulator [Paenibacillus cremeus]
MDWELVRQQLEQALNIPVTTVKWPWEDWRRMGGATPDTEGAAGAIRSIRSDEELVFFVQKEDRDVVLFKVVHEGVSEAERQLIELVLDTKMKQEKKPASSGSDEERKAGLVREWLRQQQELGYSHAEMPDTLVSQLSLYSTKIPLLLYGDNTTSRRVHYTDLKKLLESFFDSELTLIPLTDKEWLILAPEKILAMDAGDDREDLQDESMEDKLAAIGYGLHEMLESEWVGESHLAIHYPMMPAKSLYTAVLQLRETIMLGRTFHVGSNMHLPWELQLEKLVHLIPESEKASFLERVLKRLDVALDAETMTTLEQFFHLDCNVSETAKKLYIHRNTLLYRLDKFKQETGLDVRTFNDAVIVKIAMLLYKVTKRK